METEILFVQPSFTRGVARTLDLWGSLDEYNVSKSGEEADEQAFKADLKSLNKDSKEALNLLEKELSKLPNR